MKRPPGLRLCPSITLVPGGFAVILAGLTRLTHPVSADPERPAESREGLFCWQAPTLVMQKAVLRKCYEFTRAREVRALGLYPYGTMLGRDETCYGAHYLLNGRRVLMFGSNDYLGLTHDPRVMEAARDAVMRYGSGCSGSRMLNGTLTIHRELETELAAFLGREDVALFSTGYQANHGTLTALAQRGDVILMDRDNHASLVDGCLSSLARMVRYRHNCMDDLEATLESVAGEPNKMIVADAVFSMQGDTVDLPNMVRLAERYGTAIYLDEAHSIGVFGDCGRGIGEHFGLEEHVDVTMGTFSKSLAAVGGFVAAAAEVIDYVRHHCRSYIFSASLPPGCVAAVRAALRIIRQEPERRKVLLDLGNQVRRGLEAMGFSVLEGEAPIIPVIVGDEMAVMRAFHELLGEGVYVNPVLPPAASRALLRISCMSTHTPGDVERLLEAMAKVGKKLALLVS
ncbi:MAG: aminotransferase class I/II-fold pyridoxal phosphate-dependent enzyme [Planctomycetota bacterium]